MDLNPRIVDDLGRERYTFGGPSAEATGVHRGWCWSREWFIGARSTEPILAIWPMGIGLQPDASGVWGICLSSAGKYLTEQGGPTAECRSMAIRALRTMFDRPALDVDVRNLMDVVVRHLPDVILMPPAPLELRQEAAGQPLLEVELKDENTGKVQREVSI